MCRWNAVPGSPNSVISTKTSSTYIRRHRFGALFWMQLLTSSIKSVPCFASSYQLVLMLARQLQRICHNIENILKNMVSSSGHASWKRLIWSQMPRDSKSCCSCTALVEASTFWHSGESCRENIQRGKFTTIYRFGDQSFSHFERMINGNSTICDHSGHESASFDNCGDDSIASDSSKKWCCSFIRGDRAFAEKA